MEPMARAIMAAPTAYSSAMPSIRPATAHTPAPTATIHPRRVSTGGELPPSAGAARGDRHHAQDFVEHVTAGAAGELGLGGQQQAVAEDRRRQQLDVVGDDVLAPE